jgi:type I restriction enzyme M protein
VIDPRFVVTLKNCWKEKETVDATPRSSDGQLLFLMEMVDKMKPLPPTKTDRQTQRVSHLADR